MSALRKFWICLIMFGEICQDMSKYAGIFKNLLERMITYFNV